ncbi:surface antigen protein [Metarhizium robertsii]|uniref:Cysteine, histidine-dependent amidohydrolase/peptidase n=2 Tax=Metarhizium robertsii TaxID=568076 RepID=E9F602_METRA|nr:Cysteine, histidine-dependent amidohydrolase/peptidase [Metarhizium robertsii ARSEF 23]EFY96888.1 Cysteine, histidine-dependent amidohydrolase/peptidase [Metarhizium robertsii ARSEF 23]EXU99903.1 surface antigen protein [Metarhizium robertsii]
MKFTASIAALVLLQGFAMALPQQPGVQAVGENRLPLTYPRAKAPHKGGSCKPKRPTPDVPGIPNNGTQPGDNPTKPSPPNETGGRDPGEMVDDYPDKNKCGQIDSNDLTACQCTGFAAFRAVKRMGVTNFKDLGPWGDAKNWAGNARAKGLTVNNTAAPGAIACSGEGTYGHVGFVHAVDGGQITMEDYNGFGGNEKYGHGEVSAARYSFIHL